MPVVKTASELVDDYERNQLQEFEGRLIAKSPLYQLGDGVQPL